MAMYELSNEEIEAVRIKKGVAPNLFENAISAINRKMKEMIREMLNPFR